MPKKGTTSSARKKASKRAIKKKAAPRKHIQRHEELVVIKCRRKCCLCYALRGVSHEKDGQIVHLDHVRSNPKLQNLVYLCLDCHTKYDIRSNRIKGYFAEEVRTYRDELYKYLGHDQYQWQITLTAHSDDYDTVMAAVNDAQRLLRKHSADVSINVNPLG